MVRLKDKKRLVPGTARAGGQAETNAERPERARTKANTTIAVTSRLALISVIGLGLLFLAPAAQADYVAPETVQWGTPIERGVPIRVMPPSICWDGFKGPVYYEAVLKDQYGNIQDESQLLQSDPGGSCRWSRVERITSGDDSFTFFDVRSDTWYLLWVSVWRPSDGVVIEDHPQWIRCTDGQCLSCEVNGGCTPCDQYDSHRW